MSGASPIHRCSTVDCRSHPARLQHPAVSDVFPASAPPLSRALETAEIASVVEAFRKAAENAHAAEFDGVELHGANGYLLDQFLQDKTNRRTDEYGGSISNRARLMLEATDAAIEVWGPERVGMHLNLGRDSHDIDDSTPEATFSHV